MNTRSFLYTLLFCFIAFTACDKKDGPVANVSSPGAPSIVSPSSGESFTLNRDQPDDISMTIEWSKPDFGFSSAPTYTVELGVAGDNFANPMILAKQQKTSYPVVTSKLNEMLLTAGLAGGEAHSMELRVTASISDSVSKAVSQPVELSITPFQTDFPPLYMIGEAVGGWSLDLAVIVPSTEANVYSNIAKFTQGEAFRFFSEPDWESENYNYPYFGEGSVTSLLENAQDGDSNFRMTGETGFYRVTVNMNAKTVEMEPVDEPVMYMTGAGIGGWDQPGTGASVEMTFVQDGVFTATTDFINGEAFRFFGQADWSPDSYNYPYFSDGTVTDLLEDAQDGDNNFKVVAESGSYTITVNLIKPSVEMEAN